MSNLKVKVAFEESSVHYRKGTKMVKIRKLGEATQEQLEELDKLGHPGVIKGSKPAAKGKAKGGSSA